MSKHCSHCGAPHGEWVCRKLDGSNIWCLDLDLAMEQPKTWGSPNPVRLMGNGMCRFCNETRIKERVNGTP